MTAKLILKFKENVISEILMTGEETTIGRKPTNDVHIDNLAVSGHHARILRIGKKAILEDFGSTNGTLVNGAKISKHVLSHGDHILIGKHTLIYVEVPDAEAGSREETSDDVDKTMVISKKEREAQLEEHRGNSDQQKKPGKAPGMPLAGVQVIAGPLLGKMFDLGSSLTSIGKADSCKIQVKGLMIGKQAAVVTRRPNGYHIAWLEGMTKPKVNGEMVGQEPRYLNSGDIIELGSTKMEFFIKDENSQT